MKTLTIMIIIGILAIPLSACGCSNNMVGTQTSDATILPEILPTIETNIPDPDVDTEMPIYTNGSESTAENNHTVPSETTDPTEK